MIERIWEMSVKTWQAYWGEGWHVYLFLLCLAAILFLKRSKVEKKVFLGYTLAALAVFFLPFTAQVIAEHCIGESVYWRVLWLLPVAPTIAYVCTRLCTAWKNAGLQMILAAVCLGAIVFTGTQVYVEGNYHMPENQEKVPYEIKGIADLIRDNAGGAEKKRLVAPDRIATYMRIYAPDIEMAYGRSSRGTVRKASKQLHILLNQDPQETEPFQVAALAQRVRCNYLVAWVEEAGVDQEYEESGYTLLGMVDKYHVYKRTRNLEGV